MIYLKDVVIYLLHIFYAFTDEFLIQTDGACSAHCISREGQLAKLELIGSKVFQLLQKTLQPAKM